MRKILAIVIAFFLFSLAGSKSAAENEMYAKDQIYSVRGPILAVDSDGKTLTVKSMESDRSRCTFYPSQNIHIVLLINN